jgi:predicted ArsR family transcriptional regulator
VHFNVPQRQHGLLASVLVDTLIAEEGKCDLRQSAMAAASRRGRQLGRRVTAKAEGVGGDLIRVRAVLERLGFEPYNAESSVLRLGNCPFHPRALEAPELVCTLNHGLVGGLLIGMEADRVEAVLAPRSGECCVEVRPA